jgi:hypothetical protein
LASPTFTAKQEKHPQILHYVQDDKRCKQRGLKCDCTCGLRIPPPKRERIPAESPLSAKRTKRHPVEWRFHVSHRPLASRSIVWTVDYHRTYCRLSRPDCPF